MAGAGTRHQELVGRVLLAPYDVLFPKGDEDEVPAVVQPDLVVFYDPSKIRAANARGAPDLLVEILSPSTSRKDLNEKFPLYERHGVREYWVVDPWARTVCVFRPAAKNRFDRGELHEASMSATTVASRVLDGLAIDLGALFSGLE